MHKEWLVGAYKNKLVTADDRYLEKIWKDLEICHSPFRDGYSPLRQSLVPIIFPLKPVPNSTKLGPYSFDPSDWGLSNIAYASIDGVNGGIGTPAKGNAEKNCFMVQEVPKETLTTLESQQEKICVLSLTDKAHRVSRTGTFFGYKIEDSYIRLEPLKKEKKYISGKGILVGAWPSKVSEGIGGMKKPAYAKERYCPLNVGGSRFEREGQEFYITYRALETDLRFDMPVGLLRLEEEKGFEELVINLGCNIGKGFGRYLEKVTQRNTLLTGDLVDFADINSGHGIKYDIRGDTEKIERLKAKVFSILYTSATILQYGEDGLLKLLRCERFGENDRKGISKKYETLCTDFLGALGANGKYFEDLKNVNLYVSRFEQLSEAVRF